MKLGFEKATSLAGNEMRVQRFIAEESWSPVKGTTYFTRLFGHGDVFNTKQEAWFFAIKVIAKQLTKYIF